MAAREPLTPAAYRDATGTSRKYVLAILEDLDRRAILRRTPDGHVPGPKAPARHGRPPMTADAIGGIVLAGGRRARFGRDKLAEPIGGRPLLHHAIAAVSAVATDVLVVAAPGAIPDHPAGVRLARDPWPSRGRWPVWRRASRRTGPRGRSRHRRRRATCRPSTRRSCRGLLGQPPVDSMPRPSRHDGGGPPLPMAVRRGRPARRRAVLAGGERRLRALPVALRTPPSSRRSTWRQDDQTDATLRDIDTPDLQSPGGQGVRWSRPRTSPR